MLCGLITGFLVWAFTQHFGPLGILLGFIAGLTAWWIETQLHPWARCWWCRGNPRTSWSWCTPAWRECQICGGRGKRRRVLARSLG